MHEATPTESSSLHSRTSKTTQHNNDIPLSEIYAAQERIRPFLEPTPLHYSQRMGLYLKLENLQHTGSYKVRGALNATMKAKEVGDDRTIICASAGNHAQGLAWAAHTLGLKAIAVMPHGTPKTKVNGVLRWGADIRHHGATYDDAYAFAQEHASTMGYRFLSAFDDPDIIAGQGTVGLELAAHSLDAVLVPIGGGGLASGIGLALHHQGVRIIGVQVQGIDAMARLKQGDERIINPVTTIADGVKVREPGRITRRVCCRLLEKVLLVSETEIHQTVVELALNEKLITEGAGAVAVAARNGVAAKRVCAIVSGGNIDASVLAGLLTNNTL